MQLLKNAKVHNPKWSKCPDLYRILNIGSSRAGKRNSLLNLIIYQHGIDKIYLNIKALAKPKYQLLLSKPG